VCGSAEYHLNKLGNAAARLPRITVGDEPYEVRNHILRKSTQVDQIRGVMTLCRGSGDSQLSAQLTNIRV